MSDRKVKNKIFVHFADKTIYVQRHTFYCRLKSLLLNTQYILTHFYGYKINNISVFILFPIFRVKNYKTALIAAIIPVSSAIFLPAISNAVPCPGDVRIMSSPIVIFTVSAPATVFIGIRP